jgi:hypothetical protein
MPPEVTAGHEMDTVQPSENFEFPRYNLCSNRAEPGR